MICWRTDENQVIDIHLFGRALKDSNISERRGDQTALRKMLEQAVSVYQGDLLPACYDDWITSERERLRQQCQTACQKLVRLLETQREYAAALQMGQQLLRLDPLDEGTYVSLMRLHMLNDDGASAQRMYRTAVETLQRELGVGPDEALRAAYERLQYAPKTSFPFSEGDSSFSESFRLVGRQPEWQKLQSTWKRAISGDAHLALITGEAGIGKSRLAEELFNWVARQGFATAYTRSYEAEGRLSFAPVTEWLRSAALHPHLASIDKVWLSEITRLLPELLNEHTDLVRPEPITEYGQRQRFFEALARGVLSGPHPLLLWFDDLQWCDQETLEWLHFVLRFEPHNALLILGTARSEESPPDHPLSSLARQLRTEEKVTVIELSPLDAAESANLASQVQKHDLDIPAAVRLYHETEGNPFFVVETIRAEMAGARTLETAVPTGMTSNDSHALPPRVHAVILRRLAQLSPPARKVADIGAIIGCAFPLDLLLRAGNESEETVTHALDELWRRHIVREQSANVFDFTHDKLREVAYAEVSAPERRLIHRRMAQALEVLRADDLDAFSTQLATHYEQAGVYEQAISYYQRAATVAAGVFANIDAIRFLKNGLALLPHVRDDVKRDRQELELQLALSSLYRITNGWTSPEVESVLNRALILSNNVGNNLQRTKTLFGLQAMYVVQARFEKVQQTYAQTEILFIQTLGVVPPEYTLGLALAKLCIGQIGEALELFESTVSTRDNERMRDFQESFGYNYVVLGHVLSSQALWCLGYPQTALYRARLADQFAQGFEKPFNQVMAAAYLAMLQEWRTDADAFQAQSEAALVLARDHNIQYYTDWSSILVNFAHAYRKPDSDVLRQLRDSINVIREAGAGVRLPYYFSLLARAYIKAGQLKDGLDTLDHALMIARENNEHWWDAELHRLRGELMSLQGTGVNEVEQAFLRSIEIARSQSAKSLELRAATGVAQLWQAHSRSAEAKQLIVPLYEWFTEGFDTPDLQAARELIAQL